MEKRNSCPTRNLGVTKKKRNLWYFGRVVMVAISISTMTAFVFSTQVKADAQKIEKKKTEEAMSKNSTIKAIDATASALRYVAIKMIKKPVFNSILLSKKHPLIVKLSKSKKDGVVELSDYIKLGEFNGVNITANEDLSIATLTEAAYKFVNAVGPSGTYTYIGQAGAVDGYIDRGEFELFGSYAANQKSIVFESGKIIFKDNKLPGQFSEGTIVVYDGIKYRLNAGKWVR